MSEPNYCTTKFFTEKLLATETRKNQILMKKPVYLCLTILDLTNLWNCKLQCMNFGMIK